jgi:hypothetical protein
VVAETFLAAFHQRDRYDLECESARPWLYGIADLKGPDVGLDPPAIREFDAIEDMITSYVMPPQLTAELYRALGDIPGVTVDEHAVDVAGRPGIVTATPS